MNKECVSIGRSIHDLQSSGIDLERNSELGNLLNTLGKLRRLSEYNGIKTQAVESKIISLIREAQVNKGQGLSKTPPSRTSGV